MMLPLSTLVAINKIIHSYEVDTTASMGVRAGTPTSFSFMIFTNVLIRLIKQICDMDGFLARMHLFLMDDTVLLSTSI